MFRAYIESLGAREKFGISDWNVKFVKRLY